MDSNSISLAAKLIGNAEAILIAAGAGLGVDSGLPDFRGNQGFWQAYPAFRKSGLSFYDLANPVWFTKEPTQAWGFYGHRFNLYRDVNPHAGFEILLDWSRQKSGEYFIFTSNVDGHFQKAGFDDDRIVECHGSINHLQCSRPCCESIWSAERLAVRVDNASCRTTSELPTCECCGQVARPNVLMFGDGQWVPDRTEQQIGRYQSWLRQVQGKTTVIVEIGAGTDVPTVRYESQRRIKTNTRLVRINPREPASPGNSISIEASGLDSLTQIDKVMRNRHS